MLVCSFESGLILERYVMELKRDIGLFPHAEIEDVEGQMDVLDLIVRRNCSVNFIKR